ncbi:MAG: 50S ribosomal protein L6 [Candidatus Vogelbacteria bacterium]|nr:50S ribosomal protein L6 [Candidatus Vogelbacteria bacterium]
MSRIGRQTIIIPPVVTVTHEAGRVLVKGPKGSLERQFPPALALAITSSEVKVNLRDASRMSGQNALWGTYAAHLKNMIRGVTDGFEKRLLVEGIGYKAVVGGEVITLNAGFSHPVVRTIPKGLKVTVEKNMINISGFDRELVGQFAASIRAVRPPDPYKEKGIRYLDEVVVRKQGKKAVTT